MSGFHFGGGGGGAGSGRSRFGVNWRSAGILWLQMALLAISLWLAVRFQLSSATSAFLLLLPGAIALKLAVWLTMGLHRGNWRYVGLSDLLGLMGGTAISAGLLFTGYSLWHLATPSLVDVPATVFGWDALFGVLLVGGARVFARLLHEESRPIADGGLVRLLIIGAGGAAESVLREIRRMPEQRYRVVGVVDDAAKAKSRVQGAVVLGPISSLPRICQEQQIGEILIALPSASNHEMQRIVSLCRATQMAADMRGGSGGTQGAMGLRFRTIPSLQDILAGNAVANQIRDVSVNDLLGRDAVQTDLAAVGALLRREVVLVSGAGGSIGSELCRTICSFEPSLLVLLDKAENSIFEIERELKKSFPMVRLVAAIGDISDAIRTEQIVGEFLPSIIFHAAAHKHVPLAESNPGEAIRNNVFGTKTLADAAATHGVKNFVMISTDKAVNPSSIMGATKRCAEIYIQALARRSHTNFITVRFGNVLGSNGSVVPIFKQQIAAGGPVTVTHPEMRRYFMTIPEASQLVLQAGALGQRGEIFVLDMGQPVRILDLARDVIILSGLRPEVDIPIVFTGLRPGEKLYEELSIRGENMLPTRHPKIAIWKSEAAAQASVQKMIDELEPLQHCTSREQVLFALKTFVPEMKPWEAEPTPETHPAKLKTQNIPREG
jgi:FlaA1/EpsC-like NDP-sugar epimerase